VKALEVHGCTLMAYNSCVTVLYFSAKTIRVPGTTFRWCGLFQITLRFLVCIVAITMRIHIYWSILLLRVCFLTFPMLVRLHLP